MNTLSQLESKWIVHHLKIYKIKYAEIYNEVYDHMVSAIEQKRRQGDTRDILVLFQETIDGDLGGYQGIDRLCEERPRQVLVFLTRALNREFKSHFYTSKIIWFIVPIVVLIGSATIWDWEPKYIFLTIFCTSLLPLIYFLSYGTAHRYFRTVSSKRKTSLVNRSMMHICTTVSIMAHAFVQLIPTMLSFFTDKEWTEMSRDMIGYLGIWGMSFLAGLTIVYTKSIITIIQTDYNKMIREVVPVKK